MPAGKIDGRTLRFRNLTPAQRAALVEPAAAARRRLGIFGANQRAIDHLATDAQNVTPGQWAELAALVGASSRAPGQRGPA
jgi:hypothetical protein